MRDAGVVCMFCPSCTRLLHFETNQRMCRYSATTKSAHFACTSSEATPHSPMRMPLINSCLLGQANVDQCGRVIGGAVWETDSGEKGPISYFDPRKLDQVRVPLLSAFLLLFFRCICSQGTSKIAADQDALKFVCLCACDHMYNLECIHLHLGHPFLPAGPW